MSAIEWTSQQVSSLWQASSTIPYAGVTDPIYLFLVSKLCFFCGLAYTSPSSPIRFLLFTIIAITGLAALRSPNIYFIPGAVACDYIAGVIFHSSNFLLIAKRSPPPGVNRERWALREIFGARWAVTHYPPFDAKDKNYVPTRSKLLFSRALDFIVCFSLAMVFEKYHLPWQDYADPGGFFTRLLYVSQHELGVRVFLMLKGLAIPYFGLRAGHSFSTCIALLFGADPADWPPLYGPITQAYTVRRFYSHFWHHAMRSALTSHAALLTYWLMCIKHKALKSLGFSSNLTQSLRSPLARYLTTILSFLASAVMHILTCPGLELYMTIPELWLHLGTAGAVIAEDMFMKGFRLVRSRITLAYYQGPLQSSPPATNASAITTARMTDDHSVIQHRKQISKNKKGENRERTSNAERPMKPTPRPIYRAFGYLWVTCFFSWAMSNLMFALYNH